MKTSEAIAEVRKYARFIKAFEHLTEVATELAQADQLIAERQERLSELEEQAEKTGGILESLGEQILAQQDTLGDAIKDAEAEGDRIRADAHKEHGEIVADARSQLDQLNEDTQLGAIELRALRDKITSTQAEYDELWPKLATAREEARKIIEGAT